MARRRCRSRSSSILLSSRRPPHGFRDAEPRPLGKTRGPCLVSTALDVQSHAFFLFPAWEDRKEMMPPSSWQPSRNSGSAILLTAAVLLLLCQWLKPEDVAALTRPGSVRGKASIVALVPERSTPSRLPAMNSDGWRIGWPRHGPLSSQLRLRLRYQLRPPRKPVRENSWV